jgi:hypothetical protein
MKQTDILWNGNNTITAFPTLSVAVLSTAGTAQLMCFVIGLRCYKATVREEQNGGTILTSLLMSVQITT